MSKLKYLKSYLQIHAVGPLNSIRPCLQISVSASYLSVEAACTERSICSSLTLSCPHIRVGCGSETLLDVLVLHGLQKNKQLEEQSHREG